MRRGGGGGGGGGASRGGVWGGGFKEVFKVPVYNREPASPLNSPTSRGDRSASHPEFSASFYLRTFSVLETPIYRAPVQNISQKHTGRGFCAILIVRIIHISQLLYLHRYNIQPTRYKNRLCTVNLNRPLLVQLNLLSTVEASAFIRNYNFV
jgi:hypothetical protein